MFYNPQDTPVLDDLIAFSSGMRWEMPISGPLQNTSNAEIIRSYSLRLTLELQGSHLFIQRKLRIDFHLCHYHWGIGQISIPSLGTLFHYTQTHMHSHMGTYSPCVCPHACCVCIHMHGLPPINASFVFDYTLISDGKISLWKH